MYIGAEVVGVKQKDLIGGGQELQVKGAGSWYYCSSYPGLTPYIYMDCMSAYL